MSDNTFAASRRSLPRSHAQPIFYRCCGATLCRKYPVWVLWIHKGLSLQLTVKYCIVMNRLSSATIKGPTTIVVNLWIKLFCCLQAWMETPSSVWSGLCIYFLTAVVGAAHAKPGLRSKSILLNSNAIWDSIYPIWILSHPLVDLFRLSFQKGRDNWIPKAILQHFGWYNYSLRELDVSVGCLVSSVWAGFKKFLLLATK